MSGIITFTTDFGTVDGYVGALKGAVLTIAPACQLVDVSHDVPPRDVRFGAYTLMSAVETFPIGTVHLAVVDPGVGGARRALALEVGATRFVGPDNGLLVWALGVIARRSGTPIDLGESVLRLPPTFRGVVLDQPSFWRQPVSATFHGRDVFGPVAAWLSLGEPLTAVGTPIDGIQGLPFPMTASDGEALRGEVLVVDRFGNLITNISAQQLPSSFEVEVGGRGVSGPASNYESAAPLIALIGSAGFLEIAAPGGSAAAMLDVAAGTAVIVHA